MRTISCALAALAICLWSVPAVSQEVQNWGVSADDYPHDPAEILRQHNIPLTKDALLAALRNDDPEVRGLAAGQLADERAYDVIPAIAAALEAERGRVARVNIASALIELGDERGTHALQQDCEDTSLNMQDRLQSASQLHIFHDESCWKTVVEAAQSRDSLVRFSALTMIPYFKTPPELSRAFLLNGLRDQDLSVRMAASSGLINLGDVAAIPALEAAIAAETNPMLRSTMEQGVKFLQKKQQCGN